MVSQFDITVQACLFISPVDLAIVDHRYTIADDPPATRRQRHLLIPDHQRSIEIDDETPVLSPGRPGRDGVRDDPSNATPNRVFTSFLPGTRFLSLSLLLQLRLFCIVLIVRVVASLFCFVGSRGR
jgi:hypothetical protein